MTTRNISDRTVSVCAAVKSLGQYTVWWHISAITCQIITCMLTCQIFMLTCQLFMLTCQIIMSTCQKKYHHN